MEQKASPNGPHSVMEGYTHIDHLLYIHKELKKIGDIEIFFHAFMDGRDTPKNIGAKYLEQISKAGIIVASMQGRSIGMDRDRRWEKIEHCYKTMIGEGELFSRTYRIFGRRI